MLRSRSKASRAIGVQAKYRKSSKNMRLGLERLENRLLMAAQVVADGIFGTDGSGVGQGVDVGGRLIFTAFVESTESIWRSDGTAEGTVPIAPKPQGATAPTAFGGQAFFGVNEDLWATNGEVGDFRRIYDFPASPAPVSSFTPAGDTMFFLAADGVHGQELWQTDGTTAGTVMVKDIRAGSNSSAVSDIVVAANHSIYFLANDGVSGKELWKSDGTAAGTAMVKDIALGSSSPFIRSLTTANGKAFFVNIVNNTPQLWASDGTAAGTGPLRTDLGNLDNLKGVGNKAFFTTFQPLQGSTGPSIQTLWVSDGTPAGTTALFADTTGKRRFNNFFVANGLLFFQVTGPTPRLWRSDGTEDGTFALPAQSSLQAAAAGGLTYFVTGDADTGAELWKTDGTAAGTSPVRDIRPGPVDSNIQRMAAAGGTLFFNANDGLHGDELWASDGTIAGTRLVKDFNLSPLSYSLDHLLPFRDGYVYASSVGLGLFHAHADGRIELVSGSLIADFIVADDAIYFTSGRFDATPRVWKSDGTAIGTKQLMPASSTRAGLGVANLTSYNGAVYFTAPSSDADATPVLWKSDGSPAGATRIASPAGGWLAVPHGFARTSAGLFFRAQDAAHGFELWKIGPTGGVGLVRDLNPGPGDGTAVIPASDVQSPTYVVNDVVLFPASADVGGGWWRSDGTPQGTSSIAAAMPFDLQLQRPEDFAVLGGYGYFFAKEGAYHALYRTDGTLAGTSRVTLAGSSSETHPYGLVAAGNQLYFVSQDNQSGVLAYTVWASDGTPGGTRRVKTFNSQFGARGAQPTGAQLPYVGPPTPAGNGVFFAAHDGADGRGVELWYSDGTPLRTLRYADLNPGPDDGRPQLFASTGGAVVFGATDGQPGARLRRINAPTAAPAAPTQLTAVAAAPLRVELSWNQLITANNEPIGFVVERSADANFSSIDWSRVVAFDATGYTDGSVDPETTYFYRVRAFNVAFDSTFSAKSQATTPALRRPTYALVQPESKFNISSFQTPDFVGFHHRVYFNAYSLENDASQAFVSDGESAKPFLFDAAQFIVSGDTLYIGGTHGAWKTKGTIDDLQPIDISEFPSPPQPSTAGFSIVDGTLVHSGGTPESVETLAQRTFGLAVNGDTAYFFVTVNDRPSDDLNGYYLAKSDGTPQGTELIRRIPYGQFYPRYLTFVGDKLFFTEGTSLWVSDGTGAGTKSIATFPQLFDPTDAPLMAEVAGRLYFRAGDGLWTSDGTPAGTHEASPAAGEARPFQPQQFFSYDGALYFTARIAGEEIPYVHLWRLAPTLPAAPPAPVGFSAVAVSSAEAKLTWTDASTNESRFVIERGADATFSVIEATFVVPAGETRFSDGGLSRGVTYHYRIRATNAGGASAYATASTTTPLAPAAPAALVATAVDWSTVELTWKDNASDETGFRLERSTRSNFAVVDAVFDLPAGATTYRDTGLTRLTRYHYRLRAVNAQGASGAARAFVNTPEAPPAAASGLRAVGVSSVRIDLQWIDNAANETAFAVERAEGDGAFAEIARVPANTTEYGDDGRTPGVVHRYRVRALNLIGAAPYSNESTSTTSAPDVATPLTRLPAVDVQRESTPSVVFPVAGGAGVFVADGYFAGDLSQAHMQLWRTEGTFASTTLVKDFENSLVGYGFGRVSPMASYKGEFYFTFADRALNQTVLWKSDGTLAGTMPVKALFPEVSRNVINVRERGDSLYFELALSGWNRGELWKTDGTPDHTGPTNDDIPPAPADFEQRATIGSSDYFTDSRGIIRKDAASGDETVVKAAAPGDGVADFTVVAGKLAFFFAHYVTTGDGATNRINELWLTDGTPQGTRMLADGLSIFATNLTAVGDSLYFTVQNGGTEFWKSDLTPGGTRKSLTIDGGVSRVAAFGESLSYANDQVWLTDGTAAGTRRISRIGAVARPAHADQFMKLGDSVYFVSTTQTYGGYSPSGGGGELWKTDGTAGGTRRLYDGVVRDPTVFNGAIYFGGYDSAGRVALMRYDDASAAAVVVRELTSDAPGLQPRMLAVAGGRLYFAMGGNNADFYGYDLWSTDGTAAGTSRVSTEKVYVFGDSDFAVVGDSFFIRGQSGGLFQVVGGVLSPVPGVGAAGGFAGSAYSLKAVGQSLYFVAMMSGTGDRNHLFKYTPASVTQPQEVKTLDVNGVNGVSQMTVVGDILYFVAPAAYRGSEIWRSDGTSDGTYDFTTVTPDYPSGNSYPGPSLLTAVGDRIYFVTPNLFDRDGLIGHGGLWWTKGTAATTVRVRDTIQPGPDGRIGFNYFLAVGDKLVFSDGDFLWRSDGTLEGTVQIDRVRVDDEGAYRYGAFSGAAAAALGNRVIFDADLPGGGGELRVAALTPPEAPSELTRSEAGAGGVALHWRDNSTTESGFIIERSRAVDFSTLDRTFYSPVGSTSFVDATAAGASYHYRVRAVNAGGVSAPSNTVSPAGSGEAQVWVGSGGWAAAFRNALDAAGAGSAAYGYAPTTAPLPWNNLDLIAIRVPAGVAAAISNASVQLTVRTTGGSQSLSAASVAVDPSDPNVLLIRLSRSLPAGRIQFTIAADAAASFSGFESNFVVLSGDVDQSGVVAASDLVKTRNRIGRSAANPGTGDNAYAIFNDLNGDGVVNAADLVLVRNRIGTSLPAVRSSSLFSASRIARAERKRTDEVDPALR